MLLLSISCYKDEVVSVTNSNNYSVSYLKYYAAILQNVNVLPKKDVKAVLHGNTLLPKFVTLKLVANEWW